MLEEDFTYEVFSKQNSSFPLKKKENQVKTILQEKEAARP